MKFKFNDKVKVKDGFYKGQHGKVSEVIRYGFWVKRMKYRIQLNSDYWFYNFQEDELELLNEK